MTPVTAMLRLLLGLVLILNGIGTAYSGARMQLQHTPSEESAVFAVHAADTHAAKPQCHEGMEGMPPAVDAVDPRAASDNSDPACCDSGACDCVCTQHGSAVVLVSAMGPADFKHVSALHPLAAGHAAPAPPSPIRPPIG